MPDSDIEVIGDPDPVCGTPFKDSSKESFVAINVSSPTTSASLSKLKAVEVFVDEGKRFRTDPESAWNHSHNVFVGTLLEVAMGRWQRKG